MFFPLVRILCALRLDSRKNYQHSLDAGPLEFQFLRQRGYLTNPFGTLSPCFGVIGKTPGLISRNNFVKKNFVCIGHRVNILARCESIIPFAQVSSSMEQNVHTTFSLPNPLSESEELLSWGYSKILLSFLMLFYGHFYPKQQQQQCLPQFESILDAHLSRHLLPAPLRLEIENTT